MREADLGGVGLKEVDLILADLLKTYRTPSILEGSERLPLHAFPCLGLDQWWLDSPNQQFYLDHPTYFRGPYSN